MNNIFKEPHQITIKIEEETYQNIQILIKDYPDNNLEAFINYFIEHMLVEYYDLNANTPFTNNNDW